MTNHDTNFLGIDHDDRTDDDVPPDVGGTGVQPSRPSFIRLLRNGIGKHWAGGTVGGHETSMKLLVVC